MAGTNLKEKYDASVSNRKGSSSVNNLPIDGTDLFMVRSKDESGTNKTKVAQVKDLFSDSEAFVNTMIINNAYMIRKGTAIYDANHELVSAQIEWADGREGTITNKNATGSKTTYFSRTIGTETTFYTQKVEYDSNGCVTSREIITDSLGIQQNLLPFAINHGASPTYGDGTTGVQRYYLHAGTEITEKIVITAKTPFLVCDTADGDFATDLTLEYNFDGYVYVRIRDDAIGTYNGIIMHNSGGISRIDILVTGYIGDGTSGNPYPIATAEQLASIARKKYYLQVCDIDLSVYADDGWNPIGVRGGEFIGSYDGGGFRITGLVTKDHPAILYYGLFGVCIDPKLANINIVDAEIHARSFAGILAGNPNGATITNCYVSGTITEDTSVVGGVFGGMCGIMGLTNVVSPTMTNCHANVTINSISSDMVVGGLVGFGGDTTFTKCSARGDIKGICDIAGGFIGYEIGTSTGNIHVDCYSRTNVLTYSKTVNAGYSGSLTQSDATFADYTLTNVYATGKVANGTSNQGLCGRYDHNHQGHWKITDCYWDKESTGCASSNSSASPLEVGHTTKEMRQEATYDEGGSSWDFTATTGDWEIEEDVDYPILQGE